MQNLQCAISALKPAIEDYAKNVYSQLSTLQLNENTQENALCPPGTLS